MSEINRERFDQKVKWFNPRAWQSKFAVFIGGFVFGNNAGDHIPMLSDFALGVVFASPDYLAAQAVVKRPQYLEKMQLIELAGVRTEIVLTPKPDNTITKGRGWLVRIPHRISLDSGFAVRRMAEERLGVEMLPDFFLHEAIDAGRLVEVLPGWQAPSIGIYAV